MSRAGARDRERNGPFIAINCNAIPENLLESELFGSGISRPTLYELMEKLGLGKE